ncbi:MAG: dihydrodipicolinate synthase family protein [Planctomycetaceae bacterium]|nr:dihydrodipicolinate synthase family protein [Planctomycetaceae bacterium]
MPRSFRGLWPAMFTPLTESGEPNLAETERLVDLFVRQRLDGIYLLGSTGQGPLLSVAQRQAVAECTIKAAAGRIPVMLHVGAVSTEDSITLAKHGAKIGADALSSVGPIYYRVPPDAVFEHYRRIGSAADLPFFVYHLSLVNTLSLGGRDYVDRLLALPNVAGMKFTDRDLFQLGLLCTHGGDRFQVFSGADEVLCHAAVCGTVGAIGTFYNVWGPACQAARAAFVGEMNSAGSVEAGYKFMTAFQVALDEVLSSGGTWPFLRSAMQIKYNIDIGPCRAPLGASDKPWKPADVERVLEMVDAAAPGA